MTPAGDGAYRPGMDDKRRVQLVVLLAGTATLLGLSGLLFGEGTKGIYALTAIINGALVVTSVLGYRARRDESHDG